jgi:hypothetical protein
MAIFLEKCIMAREVMLEAEHATEVHVVDIQMLNLILMVGTFMVLIIYVGFYAYIYKTSDCVRRSEEGQKQKAKLSLRRWFQPFVGLNADPDDPESTEWLGDWSTDCDSGSNNSDADDETD